MTDSANITIYRGSRPPANPGPDVLWLDESVRGLRIPTDPAQRVPVMGSAFAQQSATQEADPQWNSPLQRYELFGNVASASRWCYSLTGAPTGPYSLPVVVLGAGQGGEPGACQQCHIEQVDGVYYALYTNGNTQQLLLATAPVPTDPTQPPVFTKRGVVATSSLPAGAGSPGVVQMPDGRWALFWERNGACSYFKSEATLLSDLVAKPFVEIQPRVSVRWNSGVRVVSGAGGRPHVFLEDGKLVMYHHGGGVEFRMCGIHRSVCYDLDMPTMWVMEDQDDLFVMRQKHQLEIDQTVDFRLVRDEHGGNFAFSTAADNTGTRFTLLCTPVIPTLRRYGGGKWYPVTELGDVNARQDWINPDRITGAIELQHLWNAFCSTAAGAYTLTLPPAASGSRVRVHNDPATAPNVTAQGAQILMAVRSAGQEVIMGRNPIVSIAASGTTVTVTTKRPHGLVTTDKVTLTWHQPTAYNTANAPVTSTPTATTFTYEATAAPAASTRLGFYDRTSIEPGECFEYECSTQFSWLRK